MVEQVKAYWAVPRNKLAAVGILGTFLCLAAWTIFDENDAAEETLAPNLEMKEPPPRKGRFMQEVAGSSPVKPLRDPFRPAHEPPQEGEITSLQGAASVRGSSAVIDRPGRIDSAKRNAQPRLAGVIDDGNRMIALLEYQSESRACGEGEMIGPYRVTRILDTIAVLDGRGERLSLQVSR